MNKKTLAICVFVVTLIYFASTANAYSYRASYQQQQHHQVAQASPYSEVADYLLSFIGDDVRRTARSGFTSIGLKGDDVLKVCIGLQMLL